MSPIAEQPMRKKKCHNCGVPCWGTFCCEWCTLAYAQRKLGHGTETPVRRKPGDTGR